MCCLGGVLFRTCLAQLRRILAELFCACLFNLVIGTILSVGLGIISAIATTAVEAAGSLSEGIGFLVGAGAGGYGGAKIGAAIGTMIMPGVGTAVGGVLGGGLGVAFGGKTGSGIGGFVGRGVTNLLGLADGGTVTNGGIFLVGERGPELVSLPAGSAVFNNPQTRSMGTTINVSVNGRVGASDAELDDIARKIGRKINLEMNRYNNTGYRV